MSGEPWPRPWLVLVVVAVAQLMVVLDGTIVHVALPTVQVALDLPDAARSGVVTAYTLTFGGFLVLGGRLGDRWGHRRTWAGALAGFTVASVVAGAAWSAPVLLVSRAVQGMCAAALVPSGVALLSTTFAGGAQRARAFAVHGAISAGGAAIGLAGGGVITEFLGWRWCFMINLLIGLPALVAGRRVLPHSARDPRVNPRPAGAVLLTGGLASLIGGCVLAPDLGAAAPPVIALVTAGLLGVVGFGVHQARADRPLVPAHLLADGRRLAALAAVTACSIAGFGMFLVVTYYLQEVRHWSPVATGLGFLPLTAAIVVSSTQLAARFSHRVPLPVLVLPGLGAGALGMLWLTRLHPDGGYAGSVLPVLLLVGVGQGLVILPALTNVLAGAAERESAVAGATVNAAQQAGGALGTAVLNTVAVAAAGSVLAGGAAAVVHGFTSAAAVAAALSVASGLAVAGVWWRDAT